MSTDQLVRVVEVVALLSALVALVAPRFCKPRTSIYLTAVFAIVATACFFVADAYTKPSGDVPLGAFVWLLLIVPPWMFLGARVLEEPAQWSWLARGVRALLQFVGGLLVAFGLIGVVFAVVFYLGSIV